MRWKKVSEHPLPEGDGEIEYLLKADYGAYDITKYPRPFLNIVEWCEFNPDEIESAEIQDVNIESGDEKTFDVSEQFKNLDAPYLLNELHDEIESVDSLDVPSVLKGKSEYKSATEVMGEFRAKQEAAMNQALFAKRLVEEPTWEEKFRWETAARVLCGNVASYAGSCALFDEKRDCEISVKYADELIAVLKRGRE